MISGFFMGLLWCMCMSMWGCVTCKKKKNLYFEGKPMFGHMIIVKAKSFYNEIKITFKCPFSEGWLLNFEVSAAEGDFQVEYSSVSRTSHIIGAVTTNYLKEHRLLEVVSDNLEYLIIRHLSCPLCARLKEFC